MNEDVLEIVVDGRSIGSPARAIRADNVLRLAGQSDGGLVIRVDGGRASHFDPDGAVEFSVDVRPEFRTFRDGSLHHLRVGGLLWDWGGPAILESDIRAIAAIGEDQALYLEGAGEPIRRGGVVDLTTSWPPKLTVRDAAPDPARVPVIVNGRSVTLERPDVTFEDLVGLAFPGSNPASPGMRALTVTFRKGPAERPEGSLVPQQGMKARQGEVFHVTATDKS